MVGWRHSPADQEQRKARMAQMVADGSEIIEAGRSLGLTRGQTSRLWQNIRREMGPQAC